MPIRCPSSGTRRPGTSRIPAWCSSSTPRAGWPTPSTIPRRPGSAKGSIGSPRAPHCRLTRTGATTTGGRPAPDGSSSLVESLDRVFDRIYSSKYNPLHRTGTLASLCLTVALVTGVYLLFVYEIARPYESMVGIQKRRVPRTVDPCPAPLCLRCRRRRRPGPRAPPAGPGQDVGAESAGLDHGRPARRDDVRVRRDRVRPGLGRVRPEAGRRGRQDAPARSALPRASRSGVRRGQAGRRAVLLHEPLPPRGRPAGDDRLSVAAHLPARPGGVVPGAEGRVVGPHRARRPLGALARSSSAGGRPAGHSRPREHGLVLRLLASLGARLAGRRARRSPGSSAACFCWCRGWRGPGRAGGRPPPSSTRTAARDASSAFETVRTTRSRWCLASIPRSIRSAPTSCRTSA